MPSNCTAADAAFGPLTDPACRSQDFTLHFEQAIFALVPAAIFAVAFPARISFLARASTAARPSWRRTVKLTIAATIACLELALVISWSLDKNTKTPVSIAAATVNFLVALQTIALSWIEDARSVRPSTLLSLYLVITVLLDLPQARTLWLRGGIDTTAGMTTAAVVLKTLFLCVENIGKRAHLLSVYRTLPPEATSGIVNRSVLWWINDTFRRGFRTALAVEDLDRLDDALLSGGLNNAVTLAWASRRQPERRLEFPIAVARAVLYDFLAIIPPRLCLIGFIFAQPYLFHTVLSLLTNTAITLTATDCYGLVGATAIVYVGLTVLRLHYNQKVGRFKVMFRGASVCLIYDKALQTRDGVYDESAAVTLMSTDVDQITECLTELNEYWARAIEVTLGVSMLAKQLGWVCVVPLALVVGAFFAAKQIASRIGGSQKVWVDAVQRRIALTSSMLLNIRSIRMAGLGKITMDRIQQERILETEKMSKFRWYIVWQNTVQNVPWGLAPAATFAVVALSKPGSLDTAKIFTSLSIITLLTDPAAKLLSAIPATASSLGCIDRIQGFLLSKPREDSRRLLGAQDVSHDLNSVHSEARGDASGIELQPRLANSVKGSTEILAVQFKDVFARPAGADKTVLQDVSFSVVSGSIAAVVGSVASGKSTLLRSILGEAELERGTVSVRDQSVAYCSQSPWLPDTTIKKSICGPFRDAGIDTELYDEVIDACALKHDIALLSDGDNTKIGSGGGILSGGQRQRVSLARALYSRPKILVLDDFVSAIDGKTRRHIVQKLFGPAGWFKQRGCTVIFATHARSLLQHTDNILMLSKGRLERDGTYDQLVRAGAIQGLPEAADDEPTDGQPEEAKISAVSETVAEANERADLRRRVGDLEVYQYYFKSISWLKSSTFVGFTAVHVFAATFTYLWLNWWISGHGTRTTLFAVIYLLLGILNVLGIAGYACAPQPYFTTTSAGDTLNRFSQDMSLVETQLATGTLVTVTNLLGAAAEAALIAMGSPYMAATVPFLIAAVYALQKVYLRTSQQLRLLELETRGPPYANFLETLDGVSTIRAFGWELNCKQYCQAFLDRSQRPTYLLICIQTWLNMVLDLIVAAEAAIVVLLGLLLKSSTNPALLGVSLNNILSFNASLASVIGGWTLFETSLGAISRLRSFEQNIKPEDLPGEVCEPPASWPVEGRIEMRGVDASHSGKSSLVATFARLLEIDNGVIKIDGYDLATIPRDIIRERLVAVPQDAPVLIGTLRFNTDPAGLHVDAAIEAVLRQVGLWDVFESGDGLDTEMTMASLSHGQRQLLSIARAMLKGGRVVLLDEPTSSIDEVTDGKVQQVLREAFQGCTVITVAHRINTIHPGSDVVVVMEGGQVVEAGAPDELLRRRNGHFAQFVRDANR
ncbi:ABC transporter, transmembrane domain, type 1 [Cordyceps fumosorosea ARSEF 2679]|uniref:ABC transporter, transmembrane domain, type 1 n=1 Tax=Cordyceps fumosorosea (strain ARSEF 2679) TaxID=1081104 RepID=A0A167WL47_CORFA|nr:ABC transporter, transmembrane domain, type 1 [Cordyceps fumosorosea ARSEF 2679]OAA63926.1 ABC transporter, transmembrane domain, type 1 [Cordyceps fumosorosea ARSEF 2679]